jgi:hypothetical protein
MGKFNEETLQSFVMTRPVMSQEVTINDCQDWRQEKYGGVKSFQKTSHSEHT